MSDTIKAKTVRLFRNGNEDIKMQLGLLIKSALVLKGCKQSGMFFAKDYELSILADLALRTKLCLSVLYSKKGRHLVFIYRKDGLLDYLGSNGAAVLLRRYGYEGERLENLFSRLRKRMSDFYNRDGEFPHEIGLFLCYPLCDIQGFVKNGGKNFLFSGYWKVYDDLEANLKIFEIFDRVKEEAVDEWLAGRTLYEIAV